MRLSIEDEEKIDKAVREYWRKIKAFDALLKFAKRYVAWQEDVRAESGGELSCQCADCCECEALNAIALAEGS